MQLGCWYRKPQVFAGNKESEGVYDNPDEWAHVNIMLSCGHVCTTNTYRSVHEQMEMTECAAYGTHQPQYTTDVYEPVTTTT